MLGCAPLGTRFSRFVLRVSFAIAGVSACTSGPSAPAPEAAEDDAEEGDSSGEGAPSSTESESDATGDASSTGSDGSEGSSASSSSTTAATTEPGTQSTTEVGLSTESTTGDVDGSETTETETEEDHGTIETFPTQPGAVESPLYTATINGEPLFVEKLTKFAPEMEVHYAHASVSEDGTARVSITVNESFSSYTLSPTSKGIVNERMGDTITFESGPNYLILQVDEQELLFILLDAHESDPPRLGDPNVKSIADYGVDSTGETLQTAAIQAAIDAASGAEQNILYFPPGKYMVGELWMRSNMTLYLAGGALLYGSNATGDFNTGDGGINIEGCQHGMIRFYRVQNAKILGRGVIDANGKSLRAQNDTKLNLMKIEESSDILIDGVLVRDSSFWNTLIYRSDAVTISNYKMINCRPTTTTWNNTDGVNFDESTHGRLYNAFLYTGDDSMATKNEEPSGTVNTTDIVHEKVVCYTNSVGCKIGTKTMGQTMDGVVFRDIDIVKAGRALNIDAYDTAVVQNTIFENIRVEQADSVFIALDETNPPYWRDAANQCIIRNTQFIDVSSETRMPIQLQGRSTMYGIEGVHFRNLTVQGNPVTSADDPDADWIINANVSDITFE